MISNIENSLPQMCRYSNAYCVVTYGGNNSGLLSGIYSSYGDYIQGTAKRPYGVNYDEDVRICKLPQKEMENCEELNDTIIYIGHFRFHYGHFLIDDMSRVWWALCDNKYDGIRIGYINSDGFELPEYYKICLRELGIHGSRLVCLNRTTRIKEVYVPEKSYSPGRYIYKCYFDTFHYLSTKLDETNDIVDHNSRKLFLSRACLHEKNDYGEKVVEDIARNNGYYIVHPEKMSFIDQVKLYHNASIIVSPNGTIAHNILWANHDCKQFILERFEECNMHQLALDLEKIDDCAHIKCYVKGARRGLSCYRITDNLKMCFPKLKFNRFQYLFDLIRFRVKYIRSSFIGISKRVMNKCPHMIPLSEKENG